MDKETSEKRNVLKVNRKYFDTLLIAKINRRNLTLVGLLVLVVTILGAWMHSGVLHRELLKTQTKRIQGEVYLWSSHFRGLPKIIGQYPLIQEMLRQPTPEKQDATNFFLLQLTDTIGVNFAYVFDKQGTVLAASNYYDDQNFINDDYSFRPYVLRAMKGDSGSYMAVGMRTNKRGFYFSAPVRDNGEIIGGVALKVNIDFLATLKVEKETDLLFLDEKNIVFYSSSERFDRKALTHLSAADFAQLDREKRYSDRKVAVIRDRKALTHGLTEGMSFYIDEQNSYYSGYKLPIPGMELSVMSISTLQYRMILVAKWSGVILLLYISIAALLQVYKGRRRHHQEIEALNDSLEIRVLQLGANLKRKNEQLELSLEHYKRTQRVLENTQSELIQTAKLAVLGEMAAGLNHELNQPLQALIAYSQNAKKFIERQQLESAEHNLDKIALIATNMAETVAKFKVFSRRAKPDKRQTNISEILNNVSAVVTPQLQKQNISYHVENHSKNQTLQCEPVMISQVLVNLISNAANALDQISEGIITLEVTDNSQDMAFTVIDNGKGMNEYTRNNLFEPFYTTKEKGLGLGLTISKRIVESQDGTLMVKAAEPQGTAFTVSLPIKPKGESS